MLAIGTRVRLKRSAVEALEDALDVEIRKEVVGTITDVKFDTYVGTWVYRFTPDDVSLRSTYTEDKAWGVTTLDVEIYFDGLDKAIVGDDRPAPNGDEFETMIIRLCSIK